MLKILYHGMILSIIVQDFMSQMSFLPHIYILYYSVSIYFVISYARTWS